MEVPSKWATNLPFLRRVYTIQLIQLYRNIKNAPGVNPQDIHDYREELKYRGIDIDNLRNDYSIAYLKLAISEKTSSECERILKI